MRFYTDHNVALRVAVELRSFGHLVATARERGRERAGDDEQLLVATLYAEILLSHNEKDFVLLHDARLRWSRAWNVNRTSATR